MVTIADKLTYLNETKTAIKNAIVSKGVAIEDTDTFRSYADKIGEISGGGSTEEWQPNPNWWDIKKILDEDTRDYPGKVGVILYNFNDVSDFTLSSSGMTAVATSDGAFYSYVDNGQYVTHNWDTTQDKDDGRGFKTRWVIYYYTTDTTSDTFNWNNDEKFGWSYNYIAYLVLRINCVSNYSSYFCRFQLLLEAIDTAGYSITGTDFTCYFGSCYSLAKLPDGLDTSNGTNFNTFCHDCYSLTKLPDNLDTSNGTDFGSFCSSCYSLTKLSDNLDTSNGTNFRSFCFNCNSLTKLPDNLDTSNGTDFGSFCYGCYSLTKLPDGLDTSNGTDFYYFCYNCDSLTKLPDGLDTSNGTNFYGFCYDCDSLTKLPDGLDTSNGTNFGSFCYGCDLLQTVPTISMAANTTNISSKHNGPFPSVTWLKTIYLTLPSNTNLWLDFSTRISIESFRYIADHAPDVTATPRTFTIGSTNISRCNEADPTIITDLNAKGWTVA